MTSAPQAQQNSTCLTMMTSSLPVLIDLPHHRRIDDDESVVERVAKD
jgi:hypothetical protein